MANKKSPTPSSCNILQDAQLYVFALAVLSLAWLLTGGGHFWPIWFLIGWITGPVASKYFKQLYAYSMNQWTFVQRQVLDGSKSEAPRKKSSKSKTSSSDDSDIAGA